MRQAVLVTLSVLTLSTTASFAQAPAVVAKGAGSKLLPGTRSGALSTIEGKAVNAVNNPLGETPVRLRDARLGRIVDTTMTDKHGAFIFRGVDPGSYVVEVMDGNNTVVAASPLLNVSSSEVLSALVKVPFRVPTVAGLLGTSSSTGAALTTAAQAVIAAAAASNTVAQDLAGAPATSTSAANGR
jgi:hypothetical protein